MTHETPTKPLSDDVLQAAERLRRVQFPANGERFGDVYGDCGDAGTNEYKRDLMTLSLFALSILPKGERPVPVAKVAGAQGFTDWCDGRILPAYWEDGEVFANVGGGNWYGSLTDNLYATAEDAKLARHWKHFDALARSAS